MNLGESIKHRREQLKLSQECIAEWLGVSRQAVSKWETGLSEPTASNLIQLAEVLEISLSELVEPQKNDEEQTAFEKRPHEKETNPILRTNLTKWAIIFHAAFLNASAIWIRAYLNYPDSEGNIALVIFGLTMLFICSTWMASNHRFETDKQQRRRNANIELGYCIVQVFVLILGIYFGFENAATVTILVVGLVYILYINPKMISRKLTK